MQLFYCNDISLGAIVGLDADESRHAARVLRLREGDSLCVADGRGSIYDCRMLVASERGCTIEAIALREQQHRPYRLCLAVAPTKNPARMEWMVEKAVEVGVDEIVALRCDRSERADLRTDRLQRVALSAMKQSLHAALPTIASAQPLAKWLDSLDPDSHALRLIAHCDDERPRQSLIDALRPATDTIVMIGPEGDFSPAEVQAATQAGFCPISLGPSRLRTETAAIYAATALNLINDHTA